MARIHHMISKQARKHGIGIALNGDGTVTMTHEYSGTNATGADAKAVMATLLANPAVLPKASKTSRKANGAAPAKRTKKAVRAKTGERKEKKTIETGKSGVMVLKYHTDYMNNGGGNGDQLDTALRNAVTHVTETGRGGGKKRGGVDMDELKAIAQAHGVWDAKYEDFNPGMARMNVSNRLRAMVRRGEKVVIDGKSITRVKPLKSRGGEDE